MNNPKSSFMKHYIFYTEEGTTIDPQGNHVENCQVLGTTYGVDREDALKLLTIQEPWILEHGFDPKQFISVEMTSCEHLARRIEFLQQLLNEGQQAQYQKWLRTNER